LTLTVHVEVIRQIVLPGVLQTYLRQGLYQWANDVLIPKLYYTVNYNGESSSSYEQGYLADMYSWRLGPTRLRQLRVKKGIIGVLTILNLHT